MTVSQLTTQFKSARKLRVPFTAKGQTAIRFQMLAEIARENLSLARLAEAHFDAIAILAEAGKSPHPNALYGVWASEAPNNPVTMQTCGEAFSITGKRAFCTGSSIVDRALITVAAPHHQLVDLDLRTNSSRIHFATSAWKTEAFAPTQTATATFENCIVNPNDLICGDRWYLARPGFWHGAIAPAACWAGGALGLIDYAKAQSRKDPHTLAHLGALLANEWALRAYLKVAGEEIDADPTNSESAQVRALTVRHLIDQACNDVLTRFARAYGPYPLAMVPEIALRHQELTLYIRQSHAERDLESLASLTLQRL